MSYINILIGVLGLLFIVIFYRSLLRVETSKKRRRKMRKKDKFLYLEEEEDQTIYSYL